MNINNVNNFLKLVRQKFFYMRKLYYIYNINNKPLNTLKTRK